MKWLKLGGFALAVLVLLPAVGRAQSIEECRLCAKKIAVSAATWSCLVRDAKKKRNSLSTRVYLEARPIDCAPKRGPGNRGPGIDHDMKPVAQMLSRSHAQCIADRGDQVRAGKDKRVVVDLTTFCR